MSTGNAVSQVGTRAANAVFGPIGSALDAISAGFNRLPKAVRLALLVLGVVFAYALPLLNLPIITTPDSDFGGVLFDAAAYALIAVGLNIVIGYAGLLDLGYVGFYATGAYTVGVLTEFHGHWPFFLALPVAIVVTMVAGLILGISESIVLIHPSLGASWAPAVSFILLLVILGVRPQGLFGR